MSGTFGPPGPPPLIPPLWPQARPGQAGQVDPTLPPIEREPNTGEGPYGRTPITATVADKGPDDAWQWLVVHTPTGA